MPNVSRRLTLRVALGLLPWLQGRAAGRSLTIAFDPERSHIGWTLKGNVHEVHGTFRLASGKIGYDTQAGRISGDVVVDARSGESGNSARDGRMHRSVLESGRFPEVRFEPQSFSTPAGSATDFTTTVNGTLTLHGKAHPLSIPVRVNVGAAEAQVSGAFVIPYVAWGLKDPSTFIFRVNKEVQLEFSAVGRVQG